mmetsp:Transcript_8609/g.13330  ORF Transcript_8609/g.13330 Transcript_8609/m.13330 type:complete len:269 (+) Transcript_8609:419-1225(+)
MNHEEIKIDLEVTQLDQSETVQLQKQNEIDKDQMLYPEYQNMADDPKSKMFETKDDGVTPMTFSGPKPKYKLFRSASVECERKLYDPITEYVFKKYLDDNCEFCKHAKLQTETNLCKAISICNFKMEYFEGCGKQFCKLHGLPHVFDIPEDDLVVYPYTQEEQAMNLQKVNEELPIEQFDDIFPTEVRFCNSCEDQFKYALKKRKWMPKVKLGLYSFFSIVLIVVLINVYLYVSEYIADQNERARCVIGSIPHLFGQCENKYSLEYKE